MKTINEKLTDLLREKLNDPDAVVKVFNNLDAVCANGIWYDYAVFQDDHVEVWELSAPDFVAVYVHEQVMDDMCVSHEIERDGSNVYAHAYDSDDTSHSIWVNEDLTISVKSTSETSTDRETFKTFPEFQKGF